MAVRRILLLGEKALRDPGVEVEAFDDELHDLVEDMLETMYFAEGIGLAAPQTVLAVDDLGCVLATLADHPQAAEQMPYGLTVLGY